MNKQYLKNYIGRCFSQSFLFNKVLKNKSCILMFHRVLPDSDKGKPIPQSSIVIYQSEFDSLLSYLKKSFTIVSLPYLLDNLVNNEKRVKPLLAISFDDGWADNITYALPILKKHNIQASLFIANQFISSRKKFWWTALSEYLVIKQDADLILEYLDLNEHQQHLLKTAAKCQDAMVIDELISSLKNGDQQQLDGLSELLMTTAPKQLLADGMTWDDVQQWIDADQHIGAHTVHHYLLTHVSEYTAKNEISESYAELCHRFGRDNVLNIFCYPNGNNNPTIQSMVKNLGFDYALGTEPGLLSSDHNKFNLPRFNINSSYASNIEKLNFQIFKTWWRL